MKIEICLSTEAPQDEGASAQEVSNGEESSNGTNPDPIQQSVKTEQGSRSPPGQTAAADGGSETVEVRREDDPGNLEKVRPKRKVPHEEDFQLIPIPQEQQAAHVGTVSRGVGTGGARANGSLPSGPHDRPPPVPTDSQDGNIPLLCVPDHRGLLMFPTHQQLREAHQGANSHPGQVAAAGGSNPSVEGRREEDPGARRGVESVGNFPHQGTFQPTPMQQVQAAHGAVPHQGGMARANVYSRSHPYERSPPGPTHLQGFNVAVLRLRDGPLVSAQPWQQNASSQDPGHFPINFGQRAINTGPGLLGDHPLSSSNLPFLGQFPQMNPTRPAPTPQAMIASPPVPQQFLGNPVFPGMPLRAGSSIYGPGILPEWMPPAPLSPIFLELVMALNRLNGGLPGFQLGPQSSVQVPAPLPTQQIPPFLSPDLILPVPVFQPSLPPPVFGPQQPQFPPNFGGYGPPTFPSPRQ